MAWRFRLGSRRGETEGTGGQVAEDPRKEGGSKNVATEDPSASASVPEPMTVGSLDLAAISEIRESSAVAAGAQKSEFDEITAELKSDSTAVNTLAAQSLPEPLTASPTAETTESLLADATEPIAPAFPAIASDWAFEEKLAIHKEWVESQGLSGQKTDLPSPNPEGAKR